MVTLARAEQAANAELPIVVSESGMVTLVKLSQSKNAYSPISLTGRLLYVAGIVSAVSVQVPMPLTM